MKIGIIANCQGAYIKNALLKLPEIKTVVYLSLATFGSQNFEKLKKELVAIEEDENAIILTQNIVAKNFSKFITSDYKKNLNVKAKIIVIPNIYFDGLHPDMVYVGSLGKRILSPLAEYHSKIIIKNFFEKKDEEECFKDFNAKTYKEMGYFDIFENSYNEYLKREKLTDIKIADLLLSKIKTSPTFYTLNHPMPIILELIVYKITVHLGLSYHKFHESYLYNTLSNGSWWPIYPEIAEFHELKYHVPFIFKKPNSLGERFLTLKEFINESYLAYQKIEKELIHTHQVKKILSTYSTCVMN